VGPSQSAFVWSRPGEPEDALIAPRTPGNLSCQSHGVVTAASRFVNG
jgi:hypothetical protein